MSQFTDYPLGIRPWKSEVTEGNGAVEGYGFSLLDNSTDAYRLTAFCGAGKLPEIFSAFLSILPEEGFFILEFYQEDAEAAPADGEERVRPRVYYSPYMTTDELWQAIEPYFERLIHDGFVSFGFANNRAGMELFYSEEKVLAGFTGNHLRFTDLMSRQGVPFRTELPLPSDYGHDHLSLLCHDRSDLPEFLASHSDDDLDYANFCHDLVEALDMYPVEETLSFFLTGKEQDQVEDLLRSSDEFAEFAEEDFGTLMLDWHDFVTECEGGFCGDLWEYRQGLRLRDAIEVAVVGVGMPLEQKVREILRESDEAFQKMLVDRRKRLDDPALPSGGDTSFWYHGVVGKQSVEMRRDLIRVGWYQP